MNISSEEKIVAWIVTKQFNQFDSRIVKQAVSLNQNGYKVRIYSMVEYKDAKLFEEYRGLKIFRINFPILEKIGFPVSKMKLLIPLFSIKLFPKLIKYRPDIVYCSNLPSLHIGVLFKYFFNAKVIYDSHDLFVDQNSRKDASVFIRKLILIYEKFLAKRVDMVFQTTDSRCTKFMEYYGIKPEKVMNKPAIITNNRKIISHPIIELSQQGFTIVCYVGSIHPNRGLENVILIMNSLPNVKLIALGPATGTWAKEFIEKNKKKLIWYPPVASEDVTKIISYCDIGVSLIQNSCLSYYYSCPTKVFELIKAGIPQIASDFPEIRKLILENEFGPLGKVVNPGNILEIKMAFIELIENKEEYKLMKDNCLKMREYCSWESEEKKILSILEKIA